MGGGTGGRMENFDGYEMFISSGYFSQDSCSNETRSRAVRFKGVEAIQNSRHGR
jgi:hypothetical protein